MSIEITNDHTLPAPIFLTDTALEREKELQEKVNQIAMQMHLSQVELTKDPNHPFSSIMTAYPENHAIKYNYFFLMRREDFADLFPLEDKKLHSDHFITQIISIVKKTLMRPNHPEFLIDEKDKKYITSFILLMRNEEKYKQAKKFIIAHECAHIKQMEMPCYDNVARILFQESSVAGAGCALFLFYILLSTGDFSFFSSYASSGLFYFVITKIYPKLRELHLQRKYETDADLIAKFYLRSIQGGIYFFNTFLLSNKKYVKNASIKKYFNHLKSWQRNGNQRWILLHDHPSFIQRIENLKKKKFPLCQLNSFESTV